MKASATPSGKPPGVARHAGCIGLRLPEKDIWTPGPRDVSATNRFWTSSSRSTRGRRPLIKVANPRRRLRLKLVVPLLGWLAVLLKQLLGLLGGRYLPTNPVGYIPLVVE